MMSHLAGADEIYAKCVEAAETGLDAGACAHAYYERLDAELDKLWQGLSAAYSQDDGEELWDEDDKIVWVELYNEQQKWEEYRKSACQFFAAIREVEDGGYVRIFGTMGRDHHFPACYGRVVEQRIEILRLQLCEFTNSELCD